MRLPSEFRAAERWILSRQLKVYLVLSVLFLLPILMRSGAIESAEGDGHAIMIDMVTRQFFSGDFYPTGLPEANAGLGSPALHFLEPLPYYLALPLAWMSPFDAGGTIRLATLLALTLFLSAVAARLWLRRLFGRRAAFWGALIYMLIPFHATIGLVIRQDYPMAWSVVLLPLVLYALHRVRDDRRYGFILLAGMIAALLLTHVVMALCFAPFLFFYTLLVTLYTDRSESLKMIVPAVLLGIGAAGFHLAPQFLLSRLVSIAYAGRIGFDETRQMLFSFPLSLTTPNDALGFFLIGFFIYLGRVGGNINELDHLSDREVDRSIPWKFFTFISLTFYFIPAIVLFPLNRYGSGILSNIDLTFGCLTLFTLGATMHLSGVLNHGRLTREEPVPIPTKHRNSWDDRSDDYARSPEMARMIQVHSAVLIIFAASIILRYNFFIPFESLRDAHTMQVQRLRIVPTEYMTRWSRQTIPLTDDGFQTFVRASREWQKDLSIVNGRGTITVESESSESVRLVADTPDGAVVDLHQFYFVDQRLEVDSGIGSIEPSPNNGLIRLRLPQGKRVAMVTSGMTSEGKRGMIVSIIAMLTIFVVEVFERRRRSAS